MTHIGPAEKRQFETDGYLIVHDLLTPAELRQLDVMADRLLDGELRPEVPYNGRLPEDFYTFWEPGFKERIDLPRRQRVRLMSWMGYHHPYFQAFARHPRLFEVLATLFGAGVQFFSDTVFMKPARHGIEAALHQDTAFWPKLRPNAINYWMALDPATVENGCLFIIPGSHLQDLPHHDDPVQCHVLFDHEVNVSRQVPVELPPGSTLFFDSGLVHRSYPNRSDRSRRSMTGIYMAGDVRHVEPWEPWAVAHKLDYQFHPIEPLPSQPAAQSN